MGTAFERLRDWAGKGSPNLRVQGKSHERISSQYSIQEKDGGGHSLLFFRK